MYFVAGILIAILGVFIGICGLLFSLAWPDVPFPGTSGHARLAPVGFEISKVRIVFLPMMTSVTTNSIGAITLLEIIKHMVMCH